MKIEILFSEVCNQFGDPQNAEYLKQSCPSDTFVYTALDEEPCFASSRPDMVIMGSMSESIQRKVILKLLPLKKRIEDLIDDGVVFLMTGNAADVFCRKIDYVTEKITVDAVGLFDIDVKTDWFKRVNSKVIGDADGNTVTGFRSQFAEYSGDNSEFCFLKVERGFGFRPGHMYEGMRKKNFIATQLLGPILPLNPDFCKYLIDIAGGNGSPAHYELAKEAFDKRVAEFRDPSTEF
ncbi:MAG: glutamine amidotransferase [Clostridia bacterium]|nr:glutamine amidotransferase [Clostridia bacterium]